MPQQSWADLNVYTRINLLKLFFNMDALSKKLIMCENMDYNYYFYLLK